MTYELRSFICAFALTFSNVGLAVAVPSRMFFEYDHLKLDVPMLVGIEIDIPEGAILTYSNHDEDFAEPIVSADARKYVSVIGPFYPTPEKFKWIGNTAVSGFQKKLVLLFRVVNQPEFHKRGWGNSLDLTYELEMTFCFRESASCRSVVLKGEGQCGMAESQPNLTNFGKRVQQITPMYHLLDAH